MGRLHRKRLEQRSDVQINVIDPDQGLTIPTGIQPDFAIIASYD